MARQTVETPGCPSCGSHTYHWAMYPHVRWLCPRCQKLLPLKPDCDTELKYDDECGNCETDREEVRRIFRIKPTPRYTPGTTPVGKEQQ